MTAVGVTRVAVVDDDLTSRHSTRSELSAAGYEPIIPSRPRYTSPKELAVEIIQSAQAAICDHRLSDANYAPFFGAELVAYLYEKRFPAVLMTDWGQADSYGPIRTYRDRIPVLMRTEHASPETLKEGIAQCVRELRGEVSPERRPRETVVIVEGIAQFPSGSIVEAFIPQWNPHEPVRFPLDLVPEPLRSTIGRKSVLLAAVNIGAEQQEDLFFNSIRRAPEPFVGESV